MNQLTHNEAAVFDFLRNGKIASRLIDVPNGQSIFQPSEPATSLFLVESGEVRLFQVFPDARRSLLAIAGRGELFGLASLGRLAVYGKLALAVGDTLIRAVSANHLRDAFHSHGDFAVQLVEILAHHLNNIWTEGTELFAQDCRLRLVRKLIAFAGSAAAEPVVNGVELHMTHAQLAQAIGAARETVSICLMELRRENLVETRRNRVIYDPQRLRQAYPDLSTTPELAIAV
jgi:CRP/FNR family transcriptional regulator, cyclic AMP receptor protein